MNYSRVYYDVNITVIYFQIGIYISQHLFENVSLLFQSQYSSLSIPVLVFQSSGNVFATKLFTAAEKHC